MGKKQKWKVSTGYEQLVINFFFFFRMVLTLSLISQTLEARRWRTANRAFLFVISINTSSRSTRSQNATGFFFISHDIVVHLITHTLHPVHLKLKHFHGLSISCRNTTHFVVITFFSLFAHIRVDNCILMNEYLGPSMDNTNRKNFIFGADCE